MGSEYKFPSGLSSITWNDTRYLNKNVIESVIIPEGVTTIDSYAFGGFEGFKKLSKIFIPNSVTRIGSMAFSYCSSLSSVTIPEGVKYIEGSAFAWCESMKSIRIPSTIKKMGASLFWFCRSLKTVVLPENYSSIIVEKYEGNNEIFKFCRNVERIYVHSVGKRIDKNYILSLFDQEIREKLSIYVLEYGYVVDVDEYNEMPTTQKNHTEMMALENQILYGRACEGYCVKGNNLLTAEEYNPIFENSIINS